MKRWQLLTTLGPGMLVAATGVGAGDLATASFAGGQLGVAVLWAVVLGAALKWLLNEGLARWQLATGSTFVAGCMRHLGRPFQLGFLLFLLYWSVYVGSTLMAACGVVAQAIYPAFEDPARGKFWLGAAHSMAGLVLVWRGGFRIFERVMSVCIAVMFFTVIYTATRMGTDPGAVLRGVLIPSIPRAAEGGIGWTVALMGGVGGTLTILCYGYWLEESGRSAVSGMRAMRIDLAVAYGLTALFGMAMVIIGHAALTTAGSGAGLIVALVRTLREKTGPVPAAIFLAGAWGALFSSLLGVWQSVPYLFADFWTRFTDQNDGAPPKLTATWAYKGYLLALAFVPIAVLPFDLKALAKYYSLLGAAFMPFLAAALLYLNSGRVAPLGAHRYRWPEKVALAGIIAFFAWVGVLEVRSRFGI